MSATLGFELYQPVSQFHTCRYIELKTFQNLVNVNELANLEVYK